ncbi:hypothetical protein [Corynebacterium diphtheriae]|uniref:hypothetical protein n=1 Tax=Corynebacterium diphtheriae TaxID=1717 RepID=UPI001D1368AD|nr:hypothetical protein [Corynebacterium diphtheriae]UEB75756.1 hypothetical protein LK463_11535 [Corynebacterium diphtheriae]
MHPRSKLSQAQRELAVDLFEEGYGSRAVANRLGVRREQVRHLEDRFRLHGRRGCGRFVRHFQPHATAAMR